MISNLPGLSHVNNLDDIEGHIDGQRFPVFCFRDNSLVIRFTLCEFVKHVVLCCFLFTLLVCTK